MINVQQDREAEPRFGPPGGGGRGGFAGGMGGGAPGGYGGHGAGPGFNPAMAGGPGAGGGGRQIYVSNVCHITPSHSPFFCWEHCIDKNLIAPLHRRLARLEGLVPPGR